MDSNPMSENDCEKIYNNYSLVLNNVVAEM